MIKIDSSPIISEESVNSENDVVKKDAFVNIVNDVVKTSTSTKPLQNSSFGTSDKEPGDISIATVKVQQRLSFIYVDAYHYF